MEEVVKQSVKGEWTRVSEAEIMMFYFIQVHRHFNTFSNFFFICIILKCPLFTNSGPNYLLPFLFQIKKKRKMKWNSNALCAGQDIILYCKFIKETLQYR